MRALEVKDLTVWFEGQERPAVEEVTFSLDEGQIAILIGPNGSGKSTVLRAILGLVPFSGEVRVFGRPAAEARRQVGYVPQRLAPVLGIGSVLGGLIVSAWVDAPSGPAIVLVAGILFLAAWGRVAWRARTRSGRGAAMTGGAG